MKIEIDKSDFYKILDALMSAREYFVKRDEMNAAIHLAPTARYSPITTMVESAFQRAGSILGESDTGASVEELTTQFEREEEQRHPDGEDIGSGE